MVFCGKVEEDRAHDGWTRLEEAEGSIKVVGIVVHIVGRNSSTLKGGLGMQLMLGVKAVSSMSTFQEKTKSKEQNAMRSDERTQSLRLNP
jgi:hypothetical protein